MKPFKFLTRQKRLFQFEIVEGISYFPAGAIGTESWNSSRSSLIKEWLSAIYFNEANYEGEKYFPEMDRVCRIVKIELTPSNRTFKTTIRIERSDDYYIEIDLQYRLRKIDPSIF